MQKESTFDSLSYAYTSTCRTGIYRHSRQDLVRATRKIKACKWTSHAW